MFTQDRRAQAADEQLVAPKLFAGPHCQRIAARKPGRLPCHGSLRGRLLGNHEPLISLREASRHGTVGGLLLGLSLAGLMRIEIERLLFGHDR